MMSHGFAITNQIELLLLWNFHGALSITQTSIFIGVMT